MDQVEMTIDAGHSAFQQERMRGTATLARRMHDSRIMTRTAGDAVLRSHFLAHKIRKLLAPRFPNGGVVIIVRNLSNHVFGTLDDVRVSLDEPIGRWDVTIPAACPHARGIAAMHGLFEIRIRRQTSHGVARSAK
ncbi:MAG TPA: hypothetical protein VMH84_07185 [Xanthobacteraceae bacterium]|nr:hypothetical protein [Xanthobacteraceae bacterium]